MRGLSVPRGYFERLAADSTAFTLPNGLFRSDAKGRRLVGRAEGTRRIAVIPALFADSPEPHVSRRRVQEVLFEGPAPHGTLTAAYLEMSRGRLTVTGEVAPWVRTSLTRAEVVGESSGLGEDARLGEYLVQALELADPDYDFSLYDNDGPDGVPNSGDDDGLVDAIAFEFIEIAASCGGNGIWPHLWGIAPQNGGQAYETDDLRPDGTPVRINAYIIQSAVDCTGTEPQSAAVIAHEFGHVLGLPDYYHLVVPRAGSSGRRWILGCWELMAAGAWGCGPHVLDGKPFGPTHFSARSKYALEWVEMVDVGPVVDEVLTLEPVQSSGKVLRIPLDDEGREFLLLEYRSRTGFDAEVPAEGVLIYHQDFGGTLRPDLAKGEHYFLTVVEQDDNDGLLKPAVSGGNRGEAGDAWGVGGAEEKLHGETSPSTRRNDGEPSTVTIHSISVSEGVAKIRLSTHPTPHILAPGEPVVVEQVKELDQRMRIAGGAMPYTVVGEVPPGLNLSAVGDELVVGGYLQDADPVHLSLRVRDAQGTESASAEILLTAEPWSPTEARLLQSFLGSGAPPLERSELEYLDAVGNRNGRYDVGDLRAWMRQHPGG